MDMATSPTSGTEPDDKLPAALPATNPQQRTLVTGLLSVAEQVMELADYLLARPAPVDSTADQRPAELTEPPEPGIYRDRDGDIWQKTGSGWRLWLQHGVAVDGISTWEWVDGHVRDYGPFIRVLAN